MDILEDAIKQGPCILAMKHQSAFETIFCSRLASHFVIVLKKQLTLIPVYRGYLQKLNSIVIDKDEGVASLRSLIKEGKNAIANGYSILIFPEGTRQTPGEMPDYKGGIGVLYKSLQVPVVPIALDTGVFWGRRAKFKHPGTITIQVLPVIPAGLEREVFMETLQTTINTTSRDLYEKSIKTVLNKKKTSFLT